MLIESIAGLGSLWFSSIEKFSKAMRATSAKITTSFMGAFGRILDLSLIIYFLYRNGIVVASFT